MKVEALIPDIAPAPASGDAPDSSAFSHILDDLGSLFVRADRAEDAFAAGAGDLQSAVYERAQADVALSVASAAAQRGAQALQTLLNMQV